MKKLPVLVLSALICASFAAAPAMAKGKAHHKAKAASACKMTGTDRTGYQTMKDGKNCKP